VKIKIQKNSKSDIIRPVIFPTQLAKCHKAMYRLWSLKEFLSFLIGFAIGTIIILGISSSDSFQDNVRKFKMRKMLQKSESVASEEIVRNFIQPSNNSYEQDLADKLFKDVRILCWVFTHPDNHKKKVPHVKSTWGKRCNKLLFMSIEADPNNTDIVAIPVPPGRSHLWNKTRLVMSYVYQHHRDDADWFMRADDDKLVNVVNAFPS
jgi:hypothetical protein